MAAAGVSVSSLGFMRLCRSRMLAADSLHQGFRLPLTKGGQFDVMTIGMYEAPIWGGRGWLEPLEFGADYDVDDILPAMRGGLSHDGTLYAAPFYGESSMIMYRKDLLDAAGMERVHSQKYNSQ